MHADVSPGSGGSTPPTGLVLPSGLGTQAWLLALARLLSPCRAVRETESLSPPVSAAVGKPHAGPHRVAQRDHQLQLPAARGHWARKQRDGLVPCRKPCKLSYGTPGHGSREQNAKCVRTETVLTEHFCTGICILQGAGEAPGTGVPIVLSWRKGPCPCPQRGAAMQKLESIRVGEALTSSSSPVVFRSKDTREQRGDHRGDHRLHPRGGCAGVCHLLPAQERQDPVWPRWETGHVSTAARPPRESSGLEVLAIAHASHLIAPAAPRPTRRDCSLGGHRAGVSAALPASHSLGSALLALSTQGGDEEDSRVVEQPRDSSPERGWAAQSFP